MANALQDVLQLALVIVGIWYTWETQKLRRQSEAQLKVIREQAALAPVPYIEALVAEHAPGGARLQNNPVGRAVKQQMKLEIRNPTDRLVHHVRAVVHLEGDYLWSKAGIEALGAGDSHENCWVEGGRTLGEIQSMLRAEYGDGCAGLLTSLAESDKHFLAVLFRDISDGVHLLRREFILNSNGGFDHRLSERRSSRA